jgi:hypothetical protein
MAANDQRWWMALATEIIDVLRPFRPVFTAGKVNASSP